MESTNNLPEASRGTSGAEQNEESHAEHGPPAVEGTAQETPNQAGPHSSPAVEGEHGLSTRAPRAPSPEPPSVFDLIRKYAPPDVIDLHGNSYASAVLVSDESFGGARFYFPDDAADALQSAGPAVIIVTDIDEKWYDMFCAQFPQRFDRRLFARHKLRCGFMGDMCSAEQRKTYKGLVKVIDKEISDTSNAGNVSHSPALKNHIDAAPHHDGILADSFQLHLPNKALTRLEAEEAYQRELTRMVQAERSWFSSIPVGGYRPAHVNKNGRLTVTRISWCSLTDDIYLVLVDRPWCAPSFLVNALELRLAQSHTFVPSDHLLPADVPIKRYETEANARDWAVAEMIKISDVFVGLFRQYPIRTVFSHWSVRNAEELPKENQGYGDSLCWLLMSSHWQSMVAALEATWVRVRRESTKLENDKTFAVLARLRGELADVHQLLTISRQCVNAQFMPRTLSKVSREEESPDVLLVGDSKIPRKREPHTSDPMGLQGIFEELDDRIRIVIAALNDEIQLTIASVQIQDAKKTRELPEATVRQANWTMVLTTLAAFYLPMTLVTGIFGMNIKEINDGVPNRFWVAGTWAVTSAITLGCIVSYAVVSYWFAYKREQAKKKQAAIFAGAFHKFRKSVSDWFCVEEKDETKKSLQHEDPA